MSEHGADCTCTRCTGFQPGHEHSLVHGARSPSRVAAKARAHRRRFLRRAGLKAADLDAVANELLTHWARGAAQLDLREAGGVDAGKDYWVAYNGTRRTLEKLQARLDALGLDRARTGDELARYLEQRRPPAGEVG